jgi:hypothetical protein
MFWVVLPAVLIVALFAPQMPVVAVSLVAHPPDVAPHWQSLVLQSASTSHVPPAATAAQVLVEEPVQEPEKQSVFVVHEPPWSLFLQKPVVVSQLDDVQSEFCLQAPPGALITQTPVPLAPQVPEPQSVFAPQAVPTEHLFVVPAHVGAEQVPVVALQVPEAQSPAAPQTLPSAQLGEHEGAAQTPAVQTPEAQSEAVAQPVPSEHFGVLVAHVGWQTLPVHVDPVTLSAATVHALPSAHRAAVQPFSAPVPPQSTSVSMPSMYPFEHRESTGGHEHSTWSAMFLRVPWHGSPSVVPSWACVLLPQTVQVLWP